MWDVFLLVVPAACLSTVLGATGGVIGLRLCSTAADYGLVWRVWWLGDLMGALVFAPLILVLSTRVRISKVVRVRRAQMPGMDKRESRIETACGTPSARRMRSGRP